VNLERSKTSGPDDADAGSLNGVPSPPDQGATAETGFDAWSREIVRYHDEIARQGRGVLGQLIGCRSPLDVLKVEQAWLGAWSRAHFEARFRFAQAFAQIAHELPQDETIGAAPHE
jgi:DNA topoisomerase IB